MTDRNRRMTRTGALLAAAMLVVSAGTALADEAAAAAPAPGSGQLGRAASQPSSTGLASPPGSSVADWPQWRGPNRDGVAPTAALAVDSSSTLSGKAK